MGLKALKSFDVIVETPGGPLAVRGVSLDDVIRLVRRNRVVAQVLFDQAMAGGINLDDTSAVGAMVMDQAPDFAAEIIALATDVGDEEAIELAKQLPFPLQLELLETIGKQTFTTENSSKKVIETVARVLGGMSGAIQNLSASKTGSKVSDDR
jgi:hypothetical protein